ncbi:aminotransferase class I/II-fold pyridoxal phosphate-dependent enzyme [Falsigemmobacter intermedius]|uniref:Aminotransferase class I/II-fold pyridoxal phosphate-dependent enzyme n=1 Tax=Falsigemmobacter intermedius TaxID=1553448 RepID=A0A3S3UU85_9RHOB|nr:aminotransferase class I/II-fold pyridoxal phosphate-dependent enzyme [Falsigemmobacter intermedius]RWY40509.1 aminotransferase class I/II-fold pyridoxal phosphate-dependent enzyme [Falsigemmobacter intermedius]
MAFPERFSDLPEYAFPRLRTLLDHLPAGGTPLSMTLGEPQHPFPEFVGQALAESLGGFAKYPPAEGAPGLLSAISGWIGRRYGASVPENRLMVANGSKEALFNALLALSPEMKNGKRPVVLMPNPFFPVYMIAGLTGGAEPVYVPAGASTGFLPDYRSLPAEILDRTTVAYICSPANPQGVVASAEYLADLLDLAEKHDFQVFCDECYSEIWRLTPPPGLLEVADRHGADPERVVVFNSLSKRSNVPGLRTGFVAGGVKSIKEMRQLKSYAGAAVPLPLQAVAERLYQDEDHVVANRALYQAKFRDAEAVFAGHQGVTMPDGGFFLWLPVEDGEAAAVKLWQETGVRVLPGAYLAQTVNGENPGKEYIRAALVAPADETRRGLERIRDCLYG